jgi:membrane protein implicated in regulation of membrane protease activity
MALGTLLGAQIVLVTLIAVVVAVVTLLILRPLLRRERLDFAAGGAEHDFVIGQVGVVEEHVVNDEATGVIEIDGEIWTARANHDAQTFAPGEAVEVVAVRGAVALVDATEEDPQSNLRA